MSTWTTPITFTASTLTAAQMNAEVRDHLNFVKGALDLLTNSTTADTGVTMSIQVHRTTVTDACVGSFVTPVSAVVEFVRRSSAPLTKFR